MKLFLRGVLAMLSDELFWLLICLAACAWLWGLSMANKEHALQNAIRNALAGRCLLFRANVGKAYTSNDIVKVPRQMPVVMGPRDVLLKNARPFDTGLPPGFSDLFGLVSVEITPDMVGRKWLSSPAWKSKTVPACHRCSETSSTR